MRTIHLLLALSIAPAALRAQGDGRADILSGRVTDLTGKPIADAQVAATSLGSGLTRTHTTDAEGRYKVFFPETAPKYVVQVKRMGFAPVQRTITRRTSDPEQMTIDLQLGGVPLALSMVEVTGSTDGLSSDKASGVDATVPNPVNEILGMKDTLHLSAVQIVALGEVADTLQKKNEKIYKNIRSLLSRSQEAGDVTQMAGSVAMMLEDASVNSARAITAAEKVLRPEQWSILPQAIRERPENGHLQVPSR
ncbi:MAG TPA: carboxypeptidase-like regulatory domain-containing protein [Gemmatimonadaceae bacterium]|nr:carboxypeptidase-like regulatory domain-containing protein [Gemmatimonadaceae bacterium]